MHYADVMHKTFKRSMKSFLKKNGGGGGGHDHKASMNYAFQQFFMK